MPKELLVVGPAGTGKTFGVLDVLHCLCRDNSNLRVLVARATRAALTESVLVTYEQEILPLDGMEALAADSIRRVRQSYRYPSGSEIVLGGLDNPARVLSTAWDIVYINEVIEATEEAWQTLRSRMNRPGRRSRFGYLIGDTNPGDPSHWLRKRIDQARKVVEWVTPHEANPAMFDGRGWTEDGVRYLETLDSLTGTHRKRLRDGLWAAGEGAWFSAFDATRQVTGLAEYDPRWPVHLACDSNGRHNAAVWFQVRDGDLGPVLAVFGDWYSEDDSGAYAKAKLILELGWQLCGGRFDFGSYDPAAGARQGYDTTIKAEYERAGLGLQPWPSHAGSVLSGLNLIESFLGTMIVHPRCTATISAMTNYMRAKRNNQWIDEPAPVQHPHEDLIDSLRGGLLSRFPEGRKAAPKFTRVNARNVF